MDETEREKMNTKNVLKLAGVVEKSTTYDQTVHAYDCGIPASIAGHATALVYQNINCFDLGFKFNGNYIDINYTAQKFLEIDVARADDLFQPHPLGDFQDPTPAQAAQVLRHLAKTGEVDWEVATN